MYTQNIKNRHIFVSHLNQCQKIKSIPTQHANQFNLIPSSFIFLMAFPSLTPSYRMNKTEIL